MRTRLLAVSAVAALAAAFPAAFPANAAPAPQVTDAAGDARNGSAGADIVSATFGTQGSTAKVGRKTVYTPSKLVIAVTYAAAPSTDPYVSHQVTFTAPGCGRIYLEVFFTGTWGDGECLTEEQTFDVSYKVDGKTITYTLPFNTIGKQYLKPGATLTDLAAYTAVSEPTAGFELQEIVYATGAPVDGSIDYATSKASYKIS